MNDKNVGYRAIGAAGKREMAEAVRQKSMRGVVMTPSGVESQFVPMAVIFAFCVIFAFLVTEGSLINASGWSPTGLYRIDSWLTGRTLANITGTVTGSTEMDLLLTVFIRGIVLFLVTGILPLVALVGMHVIGKSKLSPVSAFWGATVLMALVFFLFGQDVIMALLKVIEDMLPANG